MYSIFSDGVCIHSDLFLDKDAKVLSPKWKMQDNSAGSLTFVLPKQNKYYDQVKRLSSVIQLKRDDELVFEGRIIADQIDFFNQRHITVEGCLAYFNDTTQPPSRFQNITIYNFLKQLVDRHNERVGPDKQFKMGAVTVHDTNDSIYKYTNNESTWTCIAEKLVDVFGGHVRVRYVNGERLLDYLAEYPKTSTQEIRFGENLIDFVRDFDLTKVATVIMPRGTRLEEEVIPGLDAYLDVKSVNGGSPYVTSEEAISNFGWIELVVDWDDVTLPENLLKKAQEYLKSTQYEEMVIEANLFDLRVLNPSIESIDVLDEVRCISPPHGMDRIFPVKSVEIPLDDPGNATYIFGETSLVTLSGQAVEKEKKQKKSESQIYSTIESTKTDLKKYTDETGDTIRALIDGEIVVISTKFKDVEEQIEEINNYVSEKAMEILEDAKNNATEMINMASNGFITITKNQNGTQELYITNTLDYTKATKLWKWNLNGLGYSKDGGKTFGLAMTMDGSIVADYITTGTMSANRIRTGSIVSQNGNTAWNLDTGELAIRHGSINLGNKFVVSDDGYLESTSGKIAGFKITPTYISNGYLQIGENGYYLTNNQKATAFFGLNYISGYPSEKYVNIETQDTTIYGIGIGINKNLFALFLNKPMSGSTGNANEIMFYRVVNIYSNLDMHNYYIKNAVLNLNNGVKISNGINGTMSFVQIVSMNSNGTASSWYPSCKMVFTQGILTSGTFKS